MIIILSGSLHYSSFTQTVSRNGRQHNPIPFRHDSESRHLVACICG